MPHSHTCHFHESQELTYFCTRLECTLPMCQKCLPIHIQQHPSSEQKQYIITFSQAQEQVINGLKNSLGVKNRLKAEYTHKLQGIQQRLEQNIRNIFVSFKNLVAAQFKEIGQIETKLKKVEKGSLKNLIYYYTEEQKGTNKHALDVKLEELTLIEKQLAKLTYKDNIKNGQSALHIGEPSITGADFGLKNRSASQQVLVTDRSNLKSYNRKQLTNVNERINAAVQKSQEIYKHPQKHAFQMNVQRQRGYSFDVPSYRKIEQITDLSPSKAIKIQYKNGAIGRSDQYFEINSQPRNNDIQNTQNILSGQKIHIVGQFQENHERTKLSNRFNEQKMKNQVENNYIQNIRSRQILANKNRQAQRQTEKQKKLQQQKQILKDKQKQIYRENQKNQENYQKQIQRQKMRKEIDHEQKWGRDNGKDFYQFKMNLTNENQNRIQEMRKKGVSQTYGQPNLSKNIQKYSGTPYQRLDFQRSEVKALESSLSMTGKGNHAHVQKKPLQISDLNIETVTSKGTLYELNKQVLSPDEIRKMLQRRIEQRSKVLLKNRSASQIKNTQTRREEQRRWQTKDSIINQIYEDYHC